MLHERVIRSVAAVSGGVGGLPARATARRRGGGRPTYAGRCAEATAGGERSRSRRGEREGQGLAVGAGAEWVVGVDELAELQRHLVVGHRAAVGEEVQW